MNTLSFTAAAAAILVLAGCQQKAETVTTTAPDPMAAELANAAPVELPPSMKASVAFRCKDHSLAFVDFFSGDKLANLRPTQEGEDRKSAGKGKSVSVRGDRGGGGRIKK